MPLAQSAGQEMVIDAFHGSVAELLAALVSVKPCSTAAWPMHGLK